MKNYVKPTIEVVEFDIDEIILDQIPTTSDGVGDWDDWE